MQSQSAALSEANARLPGKAWMSVKDAAHFLSMPARILRESLAKHAKKCDGTLEARLDGIIGRKFGRRWKVWLAGEWMTPGKVDHSGKDRARMDVAENTANGGKEHSHGRS